MNELDVNEVNEPPVSPISLTKGRNIYKTAGYFAAIGLSAGAVSLVLISPLILRQLGNIKGVNWTELSTVGKTYGAASAGLSAVALLGVSISLLVQTRQARTERFRITRERHIELLQIILSDPDA